MAVEQKRRGGCIQDSRKGEKDSRCSAIETRKKEESVFEELERTQRVRSEGLERVAYDPKSVQRFGGIVEYMNRLVFFYIQQKSCTYAVNVF